MQSPILNDIENLKAELQSVQVELDSDQSIAAQLDQQKREIADRRTGKLEQLQRIKNAISDAQDQLSAVEKANLEKARKAFPALAKKAEAVNKARDAYLGALAELKEAYSDPELGGLWRRVYGDRPVRFVDPKLEGTQGIFHVLIEEKGLVVADLDTARRRGWL